MSRPMYVVSGASTGIGRATAEALVARGAEVLAGVRNVADAPAGTTPIELDVTDAAQIAALAETLRERPLHGLVNNAGIAVGGPTEFTALEDWRRQFEVNLFGHVAVTQALLSALRAQRGRIVNVGSIGGRTALPFVAPYTASKAAVHSWSDALRLELAPFGVHVALVEPGSIATEIWRKGSETQDEVEATLPPEGRELYAKPLTGVRKASARTARMAIPPAKAAKVIVHALTAERPKARYLVGADARIQSAIGRLPAFASDRLLRIALGL